jgi:glutamine synthetase
VVDGEHQPVRQPDGELAGHARGLIAGLVEVGAALMAFGNRVDGSFARLVQGKEAPKTIVWGDFDRSALIRLPVVATTEDGRPVSPPTVEFRLPDGSALPHLLLAGAAQAMVEGLAMPDLDRLLERTAAMNADAGAGHRVPWNAIEVADELLRRRGVLEAGEVFPEVLVDQEVERLRS